MAKGLLPAAALLAFLVLGCAVESFADSQGRELLDNTGTISANQEATNYVGDDNSGKVNQNAANQIAQAVGKKNKAININKSKQENGRKLLDNTGTISANQEATNYVGDYNSGKVNQNAANQIAQAVGKKNKAINVNKSKQENGRKLLDNTGTISANQEATNYVGDYNSGKVNQNAANQIAQAVGDYNTAKNVNINKQKNKWGH